MSFAGSSQSSPYRLPASAWGNRQDMSIGGSDPQANMRYAAEGMPNAPYYQQRQLAGYYGAPMMSTNGVQDYGRWNWAKPMAAGQRPMPGQPQQPGQPPAPQPTQGQSPGTGAWNGQPNTPGDPWVPGPGATAPPQTGAYQPPSSSGIIFPGQPGFIDYGAPGAPPMPGAPAAGGPGSPDWWGAVRNQQPAGSTIPSWLQGK